MPWCSSSLRAATLLCEAVVNGLNPGEAARRALEELGDRSPTCIEDTGRSAMKLPYVGECARRLLQADVTIPLDDAEAGLLFMVAYTYYRRIRDIENMRRAIEKYGRRPEAGSILWALLMHAKALYIEKTEEFPAVERLVDALRMEAKVLEYWPNYVGAAHKFADLVAQLLEEGFTPGDCSDVHKSCLPYQYVARAESILRELARSYAYARSYYTLARIRLALGALQGGR